MDGIKLVKKVVEVIGLDGNCLLQLLFEKLKKEYCGDDYNIVMVVIFDSLIICGILRGGLCMRCYKEFLNFISINSFFCLVFSDQVLVVGIFLNISDRSFFEKFENIFFFVKQFIYLLLSFCMLGSIVIFFVLLDLLFKYIGFLKFGKYFDMILVVLWSVVMDYRVVIENENFVFILVNQNL